MEKGKHSERRSLFHLACENSQLLGLIHLGPRFMRSVCTLELMACEGCIEAVAMTCCLIELLIHAFRFVAKT